MVLSIVYYGDKLLRTKCEEVQEITDEITKLIAEMIETVDAKNGIGIAAPQVGKPLRIFVLRNYMDDEKGGTVLSEPKVYINPHILAKSKETCLEIEACLSIPGIREEVERPVAVTIRATGLDGKVFTEEVVGYNARVRMHENDHLNGVLFIDRIAPARKRKIAPLLKKIEDKYK